jgi:hypothetical protein
MAVTNYEPDTVVVEVEDRPSRRRPASETDMHVLVDGWWHKRIPDHSWTACGDHRLHSQFHPIRHPRLIGKLCEKCFTDYERGMADGANTAEFEKVT